MQSAGFIHSYADRRACPCLARHTNRPCSNGKPRATFRHADRTYGNTNGSGAHRHAYAAGDLDLAAAHIHAHKSASDANTGEHTASGRDCPRIPGAGVASQADADDDRFPGC